MHPTDILAKSPAGPGTRGKPGTTGTAGSPAQPGTAAARVWQAARTATVLRVRLGRASSCPPGLAEATAALQDLACQLTAPDEAAARRDELWHLQAGLPASIQAMRNGPYLATSVPRLTDHLGADCPSGALSYATDGTEAREQVDWGGTREPAIQVTKDGPYRITCAISLIGADGTPEPRSQGASAERYALCRYGIREAFHGFDPAKVASLQPAEIAQIESDARVIRNTAKIQATVQNAKELLAILRINRSIRAYLASFPGARAAADDLRRRFRFLGDTGVWRLLTNAAGALG